MIIKKRKRIYHIDGVVNGWRLRQSLETTDRREAVKRANKLVAEAQQGKLASGVTAEFARLPFTTALDKYLAELAAVRPETLRRPGAPRASWEGDLTNRLRDFFCAKRLNQISADDIRAFQASRIALGKHPNTVNHEVRALLRVLKRAKLASRLRDDVQLLARKKERRSALSEAEKQRVFETASTKPEWMTAYCAALLTANTSMRPIELKRMLWSDLDPFNRLVTVPQSKTDAGTGRVIPLNDVAWSAFAALKKRADDAGTYAPEHHIFHRQWPALDPTRPMSGWRSAWRSLRKEAAKADEAKGWEEMPRLGKFRYYDLRHQCITEMLEAGIPEGVIREVAGHVDPAMTAHYSHPRLAARRLAVQALMTLPAQPSEGGYVTNRVTKALPAGTETS